MSLSGLAQIHLELTSKCDKRTLCAFCGHQDPSIHPITYGDMGYELLQNIRGQLEPGVVVAFHRDGEPTAYPKLRAALDLFLPFTTSLVTHGLSLARKAEDIIGRCTTVTVSAFKGDPDGPAQLAALTRFLQLKGARPPAVQVKLVGDWVDHPFVLPGVRVLHRLIHQPSGNVKYAHRLPTVPECGVCLDALHRPSVDWTGRVYLCNRLDPQRATYLGSLTELTLEEIWNGPIRQKMLDAHKAGHREEANALCAKCSYWGVPSEYQPPVEVPVLIQPERHPWSETCS